MQRLSAFALLLVLCSAQVSYGYSGRTLLQGAFASSGSSAESTQGGSASASAAARSTGGTATAVARATSNAFSEAQSELVIIYARIFNEYEIEDYTGELDEWCTSAFSELFEEFKAIGSVAAEVYAQTEVVAEVDGEGEACADAEAAAQAQAEGFAAVLVDAILEASSDIPEVNARAEVVVETKIEVLVLAFAEAWSSACAGDNSRARAFQESTASAFAYPIAAVTLELFAEADCLSSQAYVDAYVEAFAYPADEVFADTISETETEGDASADAGGAAGAITATRCTSFYRFCCRSSTIDLDECTCTSSPTPRCNAVKLTINGEDTWQDEDAGVSCFC